MKLSILLILIVTRERIISIQSAPSPLTFTTTATSIHHKCIRRFFNLNVTETREMLDFAVVGFAKCGTSFLLNDVFGESPQFYMGEQNAQMKYKEMHQLGNGLVKEFVGYFQDHVNQTTKDGKPIRNGYKAPDALISGESLKHLSTYFPKTKFIVSMRHPILWFQSLWNYRMSFEKYAEDMHITPYNRIGECNKGGCIERGTCVKHQPGFGCTDLGNFHIFLSRLGWTPMNTTEERSLLGNRTTRKFSFPESKIFLMEIGQFNATNQTLADEFIQDLEKFLDVEHGALEPLRPPEVTGLAKHSAHAKGNEQMLSRMIDICDHQYEDLRKVLLEQGRKASRWITDYFLQSEHVVVSNRDHFKYLLESWKTDPCDQLEQSGVNDGQHPTNKTHVIHETKSEDNSIIL